LIADSFKKIGPVSRLPRSRNLPARPGRFGLRARADAPFIIPQIAKYNKDGGSAYGEKNVLLSLKVLDNQSRFMRKNVIKEGGDAAMP